MSLVRYLAEVVEDIEAALRHSDVHGVLGADADSCAWFRQNYEVVSMDWTLVMDGTGLYLHGQMTTVRPSDRMPHTCISAGGDNGKI